MLGNMMKPHKVMIDPQEAVKLARKYSTLDTLQLVAQLAAEWNKQESLSGTKPEDLLYCDYDTLLLLSAVFDAGRLQGIRETRERGKERARA